MNRKDLLSNSKSKIRDAELLFANGRYDSAYYLCGYAVEFALKARILKHLKWDKYEKLNRGMFKATLYKHDLAVLLEYSGIQRKIKEDYMDLWVEVIKWDPQIRYDVDVVDEIRARNMLKATSDLYKVLVR